jgi:hypothetical protein
MLPRQIDAQLLSALTREPPLHRPIGHVIVLAHDKSTFSLGAALIVM